MTVRCVEGGAREKGLDACTTAHQGEHIPLGFYTSRAEGVSGTERTGDTERSKESET